MKNLFRALRYFRPDAPRMVIVAILLVLSIAANLLKPWPLAIIVDSVFGGKPLPHWLETWTGPATKTGLIMAMSVATLVLYLGQGALSSAQDYISIKVGLLGLKRVRDEVFARLQCLSMRFYQGSKTGDLIYRAAWDTYAFQTIFQQGLVTFAKALLSLVLMVIVMWRLNGALTLAAMATVPLLLFSIKVFGKRMSERGMLAQQADSQITSFIQQTIGALPIIQSYTRERDEEGKFTALTAVAREKRLSQHGWELLYWLAVTVAFSIGAAIIVGIGSRQVLAGKLTVGELLIFLSYLAQLYEPLNQLSRVGATISNAEASTQRVFEILDAKEEVTDAPDARSARNPKAEAQNAAVSPDALVIQGKVAFERVSFCYEAGQPVLNEVSFEVAAGQSVAIIGPSGVGKTTLMNLLPRFYDPSEGVIRLDGVDLRKLRIKDLRANIALVPQEPILLTMTVAENIAFGRPHATLDAIKTAAQAANADGFIQKLPQGYETIVGEGAVRLSVGEKQRLNIARAFLKDAPILLMDEPTSALDAESEALVIASVEKLMQGRTTFIVAHRLSTIQRVEKILVLKEGGVAEIRDQVEMPDNT
jgi:ATP-binding cassette, subfamily B, bacterial